MSRAPVLLAGLVLTTVAAARSAAQNAAMDPNALEPGVTFRVYHVGYPMDRLYDLLDDQTPNVDERRDVVDWPDQGDFGGFEDHFVVHVRGYLAVDAPGRYEFRLTTDDGSRLMIDGAEIIDHDGLHAATAKTGAADLDAGLHPFEIRMFESEGGQFLRLEWRPPGAAAFDLVPPDALRTERGVTRVVSPGTKRILDGREPVRPGDGMELDAVHPAWTLERIRPEGFEPQVGGMAFLPGGDLVVSSFRPVNNGAFRDAPNGTLYVLEHATSRDPDDIVVRTLAEGFHDPLGVLVHDGDLYVCDRTAIHRLSDPDGDGSFRQREVFASGWTSDNYHHFTFGLIEHDGWLYGALSTAIYFDNTMAADHVRGTVVSMNGPNPPHRGTCFRVNLATRAIEFLCGGLRTPNGVGVGPDGEIFVTDNQGAWLPSSKLIHVRPGHFFGHANGTESSSDRYPDGGHPSLHADQPVSPPAVWFPQNEAANSPAQPLLITDGPFAGQMYVAELTMGGIRRVCLEQIGGEYQGAAFRCSQGFECGLNRMVVGPDGCLYVGGTGSDGNWSWRNRRFGLERLRPTGATAFEYDTVRATSDGFIVSFTRAVPRDWLADPSNVRVKQWTYHPTPEYGGPKYEEQTLVATDAIPAADRRSVRLVVPGLREGCVVHLRMTPTSDDGEAMWSTEAWYTLNRIPDGPRADLVEPLARPDLRAFRAETGEWAVGGDAAPWISAPSRLKRSPGTGVVVNGDAGVTKHLFTTFEHGDVEAHVEFMVPEGSNSGVYFMGRYEIQVLDSHGRDVVGFDDCGGIYQRWDPSRGRGNEGYEGVPPRTNAAAPAGTWQTFDVVFRAPRFDASGHKIADARFERVVHNGVLIHEGVEVTGPTRAAPFHDERPYGPLMLQGDHGPVAYRHIRLRTPE